MKGWPVLSIPRANVCGVRKRSRKFVAETFRHTVSIGSASQPGRGFAPYRNSCEFRDREILTRR